MSTDRVQLTVRDPSGQLAFSDSFVVLHAELQGDRIVLTLQDDQERRGALSLPVDLLSEVGSPATPEELRERAQASFDRVISGTPRSPRLMPRVR